MRKNIAWAFMLSGQVSMLLGAFSMRNCGYRQKLMTGLRTTV